MTKNRIGYIILAVAIVLGLGGQYRLGQQGAEAHDALCGQRLNIAQEVAFSEKYLADLRSGKRKPIPGITIADIQTALRRQRATLAAYEPLDCK